MKGEFSEHPLDAASKVPAVTALYLLSTGISAVVFVAAVAMRMRTRRFQPGVYWFTIIATTTVETTLADFADRSFGIGYAGSALVFGGLLALLVAACYWTRISRTALFWSAFILTRPLGAVVGDLLDKPIHDGGMALSRFAASAVLLAAIAVTVLFGRQRAAERTHCSHHVGTGA
ncbi:MAG: hypothetical protein JSS46_11105 [Proteobacteria bacterium]|nr:hypothetical protein [Pseudomonadota bacterium]